MEQLGFSVEVPLTYDLALIRVREELKQQGFGILTEIDLRAAFKEKLGVAFRPYAILGACNPPLAHKAITADPAVGLLLPCNVTVESIADDRSLVRLTDPQALLSHAALDDRPELAGVAQDARARLLKVAETLSKL